MLAGRSSGGHKEQGDKLRNYKLEFKAALKKVPIRIGRKIKRGGRGGRKKRREKEGGE